MTYQGRMTSYGHTDAYDHYVLIVRYTGQNPRSEKRDSRCPVGLSPTEAWEYFKTRVAEDLDGAYLEYLIQDLDHTHPAVMQYGVEMHDQHMP